MKFTVLHGFRDDGSFLIWLLDEEFGATNKTCVVRICALGVPVYEREALLFREDVDNRNVGIGIIEIGNIVSKLEGITTDLSILLYVDQKQIGAPVPFVVPVTI